MSDTNSKNASESPEQPAAKADDGHGHHKLGQLAATAICGNDITSSCLYVSALAIVYAGKLAPLSLLMVAAVLFLFQKIYGEVVGALPLNGGAYNALLNTTSKRWASVAACLTVLSYMATAVISALEGMHYVHNLIPVNVFWGTIGLLAFFMVLTIVGITESAIVAIVIFLTHLLTLTLLLVVGVLFLFNTEGLTTLQWNFSMPIVDTPLGSGFWSALFVGFSVSMLGISGFESSSNFVEEQEDGVFPKTLRNMWFAVSFFNPLMALLALALLTQVQVDDHQNALLAHMGYVAAGGGNMGTALKTLISIDAAMVLSGAVLTSFVGVTGLVHRMTLDRCLPQFLLKTNSRGTTHRIIVAFFLLCVSVLMITHVTIPDGIAAKVIAATDGVAPVTPLSTDKNARPTIEQIDAHKVALKAKKADVVAAVKSNDTFTETDVAFFAAMSPKDSNKMLGLEEDKLAEQLHGAGESSQIKKLAGIYTISFLAVMALFGFGNVLLKVKRKNLPRPAKATWISVFIAIAAVLCGLIGNAMLNSSYVVTFLQYFLPTLFVVGIMLFRIDLLKASLGMLRSMTATVVGPMTKVSGWVRGKIDEINSQQIVFFTRGDNISNLNNAMLYVRQNEHTNRLKVVTVVDEASKVPDSMAKDLEFLDKAYPEIDIEFVPLEGKFSPELIQNLSDEWNIPKNLMFIGSPGGRLPYGLAELGGVRLII